MTSETPTATSAGLPRRPADALLSALAERLGATLTASSVFGAPVERDGVTVVPVASVRFGVGGGGGSDTSGDQSGEGGGGAGSGTPLGYIELKDGRSRFVPIVPPARTAALGAGGALAAMLIVRRAVAQRR